MRVTADELAGVVELFGGLTRDELETALSEVAYRAEEDLDVETVEEAVADALRSYHLVEYDDGDRTLLVDGPRAFPEQPPHGEDLPHIMDVEPRHVDRDQLGNAVRDRIETETTLALAGGDHDRMRDLLDVSYDVEAWAPVECRGVRARLDAKLDASA
ncbi:DUF7109 family protein [Haloarchaeobius sp. TZWWS8]|uniref:DUF7109 family protein n=1 Tax=Haloarchaeobius sp. TZWWS8 TaxID=3446121 RepID=UPI003EBEF0E6